MIVINACERVARAAAHDGTGVAASGRHLSVVDGTVLNGAVLCLTHYGTQLIRTRELRVVEQDVLDGGSIGVAEEALAAGGCGQDDIAYLLIVAVEGATEGMVGGADRCIEVSCRIVIVERVLQFEELAVIVLAAVDALRQERHLSSVIDDIGVGGSVAGTDSLIVRKGLVIAHGDGLALDVCTDGKGVV